MSDKYFEKFPIITYNGSPVVNITERVIINNFPAKNAYLYYAYDIDNYERPDQLADKSFNDEYMDWIIYLSNGVTDPYYDWYVPDDVFSDYLYKKYGDLDLITRKILYYRNNWYTDQNVISVTAYNSLPDISKYDKLGNLYLDTAKRYYEVVLTGANITGYRRKRVDDTLKTNKIVRYAISGTSSFSQDEIVDVVFGYQSNTYSTTGVGQVVTSNSSSVTIQHTSGFVDVAPTGYTISFSNSYVYGTHSKSNCAISSISSLANNIVEAENVYWSPVTIYESEVEKNAKNKSIRMINSAYAQNIAQRISTNVSGIL